MIIRILRAAALASPRNGIVEIAGSERAPFNEIVARYLKAIADPRVVVSDPEADTSAAGSRRNRWRRWAKRASAASVWTHGSAAHRQKPDPASDVRPGGQGTQRRR